jgi:hypothetical protein
MTIDENDRRSVDFRYTRGRIDEITFNANQTYKFRYEYDPRDDYTVKRTWLTMPDGALSRFDIKRD